MNLLIPAWNWSLDGWIVLAGILSAVAAALLGNFLVLRRMSMLGDAISHAILPGLAAAFLLTGSRSSWSMFAGAVVVGILTALFTQWLRGAGNVDEGASMGIVFTSLFALGLLVIVQAADSVDLDPGCVLYGAIELTPLDTVAWRGWEVPRVVLVLTPVLILNTMFVLICYKELQLTSFDPALATTMGLPASTVHYLLMTLVAITAVASFETVGNILVVAMLIVPPATAYLLTQHLATMIGLSVVLAAAAASLGHVAAVTVPTWFGFRSTSTAGMMAVTAGLLFLVALFLSPRQGILIQWIRRRQLAWRILKEDVLAWLYKHEERGLSPPSNQTLQKALFTGPLATRYVLWRHCRSKTIERCLDGYRLTDLGREQAQPLVRSHRLWESYLVSEVGLPSERIHDKAERFEHYTDRQLRDRLERETLTPQTDPHGSPIPPEET